jgi:hypothetical protein
MFLTREIGGEYRDFTTPSDGSDPMTLTRKIIDDLTVNSGGGDPSLHHPQTMGVPLCF